MISARIRNMGVLSAWNSGLRSIQVFLAAATALGFVSVFSLRLADGMTFAVATLAVCGIVYSMGILSRKWS
ncbi:MAG: hypothetical protein ACREBU_23220 [Nitrososphaera sp.]